MAQIPHSFPHSFIFGLDPGLNGGIAVFDVKTMRLSNVRSLPTKTTFQSKTEIDGAELATFLRPFAAQRCFAVVERVHAAPNQGVVSMFSFGMGYGVVVGVLNALGIRIHFVLPSIWKSELNLSSDKKRSLALAREKFPDFEQDFRRQKDDGVAEAALLAWYGLRFLPVGDATPAAAPPSIDELL